MSAPLDPSLIPDWLAQPEAESSLPTKRPPAEPTLDRSKAITELELQTWHIAFETVLERLADGLPFDVICREYNIHAPASTPLQPSRFRTWIYRSPRRREAYLAAKAVGAEAVEDQMMRIADGLDADGNPSPNDVSRSQLQIGTRKWLLSKWNPGRYGEKTVVEQTTTMKVDPTTLTTAELNARLLARFGGEDGPATFDHESDSALEDDKL